MKQVTPRVFLVGTTMVDYQALKDYLHEIDAPGWTSQGLTDAERLTEVYGRLCYRSFAPGLNPNVTRMRTDHIEYIANLLASGHGSVLEHASVNFIFHNVSRVFTHELVRHRAGCAISQESLRYVRLEELRAWLPPEFTESPELSSIFVRAFTFLEAVQKDLAQVTQIDSLKSFDLKKKLTSAFRRLAPIGLATTIGWTANLRALRHIIPMRTSVHAEAEMRLVFDEVAQRVKARYPVVFQDLKCNEQGEWTCQRT